MINIKIIFAFFKEYFFLTHEKKPDLSLIQDIWFGNYINFVSDLVKSLQLSETTILIDFVLTMKTNWVVAGVLYIFIRHSVLYFCSLWLRRTTGAFIIYLLFYFVKTCSFVSPEYQDDVRYFHKRLTCMICVLTGTCCFSNPQLQWELHFGNLNTLHGCHREQIAHSSAGILN